jgi:hypothetical protein
MLLRKSLIPTQAKIITMTTKMKIQSAILKPNIFLYPHARFGNVSTPAYPPTIL